MDDTELLEALLDLSRELELEVRSVGLRAAKAGEPLPTSALCRVRDAVWVVLCAADPVERHIEVLVGGLWAHAGGALKDRFLAPALRERLDRAEPPELS